MKKTDQAGILEINLIIDLRAVAKRALIALSVLLVFSVISILILFLSVVPSAKPNRDLLYKVRRFKEEVFLNLKITPVSKLDYYNFLLDERLAEMEYLVNNGRADLLWSSSLRYSTTAGHATDLLLKENLPSQRSFFAEKFQHQRAGLEYLLKDYFNNYPTGSVFPDQWKFIQDGINYLDIYLGKIAAIKQ